MEILLKSFFCFFIMVTLAGFVSVRAQTTSTMMNTVMDTGSGESMTTVTAEKTDMTTSQKTTEAVTGTTGGEEVTTDAVGEGTGETGTGNTGRPTEIVTDALTTMSTRGETPDGNTPMQCYQCVSGAEDDECTAKQMANSMTTDCDGNCWITAFYEESDKFVNLTRSCAEMECTDMNQKDFKCENIEKNDDTKQKCTYCCSTDKCNGMSDASYLRYNGVILMVTIIANGVFYSQVL